jgi:hypothetical protein
MPTKDAIKCATWLQHMKYNVNASSCLLYEYACGTNSSMGEDIFDALGAAAYIGEPTGASITVDQTGNFSVGFDIAQWMAEAGIDAVALGKNPLFDCAAKGTCAAVFKIALDSQASATTGVLTPTETRPNLTFPPARPPLGFGSRPASPSDTPLPPLPPLPLPPLPPSPPSVAGLALW